MLKPDLFAGDKHNPKYDKYEYYATFGETMAHSEGNSTESHYTGLPLDNKACTKAIRVFPSQIMEDEFRTNESVAFAVCAAAIFLYITLVFVVYSTIVVRHQNIIIEELREQIPNDLDDESEGKHAEKKAPAEQAPHQEAKSVANLHRETTVLYASLAGFAEWSAHRSP